MLLVSFTKIFTSLPILTNLAHLGWSAAGNVSSVYCYPYTMHTTNLLEATPKQEGVQILPWGKYVPPRGASPPSLPHPTLPNW